MPSRVLADGEICRAIRQELLRLGGEVSKWDKTVRITRRRPPRPGGEPRRLCPPDVGRRERATYRSRFGLSDCPQAGASYPVRDCPVGDLFGFLLGSGLVARYGSKKGIAHCRGQFAIRLVNIPSGGTHILFRDFFLGVCRCQFRCRRSCSLWMRLSNCGFWARSAWYSLIRSRVCCPFCLMSAGESRPSR